VLYFSYFENLDHDVLSGNPTSLPLVRDCTFTDSTAQFHTLIEINDKSLYQEVIDLNFQNFIFVVASLYENIVRLAEIVIKKVIVHLKNRPPLSSTLQDYIAYLNILIDLGYRKNDRLHVCIKVYTPYFDRYLDTISILRNGFIHGYSNNLSSDGFNYKITRYNSANFSAASAELNLDFFSKKILDETKSFTIELLDALKLSIRHHKKNIPV
jgi:hypothetical protein